MFHASPGEAFESFRLNENQKEERGQFTAITSSRSNLEPQRCPGVSGART
ncbi:unnamed protein product, partial [Ectocarpus sp. 12 AP-2014]